LQSSVDEEIQKVGYLPQSGNGNGRNHGNGQQSRPQNGNQEAWNCSPKQRQYIIDLTNEHRLDKSKVEQLAQERFGKSVRALNKLEASGLIEELKEQVARSGRANQPAGAR
jgi:hypothetical protein